jgi:hypothetical protein
MGALELKDFLYKEIDKISDEKIIQEILDFSQFLQDKKARVENGELNSISNQSLEKIWDNEEDAIYDKYL